MKSLIILQVNVQTSVYSQYRTLDTSRLLADFLPYCHSDTYENSTNNFIYSKKVVL